MDIGLLEVGAKRPLSKLRITDTKKNLLSKAKFSPKLFFCAAILHPLLVKVYKSETTTFHYFSPRIPNLKKFGHLISGSGGKKNVCMVPQK